MAPKVRPIEERFWTHVSRGSGCWLWTGHREGSGRYGQIWVRRGRNDYARQPAHRVAWEITYGAIPEGMCVCHRCDTPLCVRPDHLFLGTQADNMADMKAKGRYVGWHAAPRQPHALSRQQEDEVRRRHAGGETQKNLSLEFGVHYGTIWKVVHRKHVPLYVT